MTTGKTIALTRWTFVDKVMSLLFNMLSRILKVMTKVKTFLLRSKHRAWCTGMTQRNWEVREVGGGIGMGNTCNSMADSCQCMTKPTAML